MLPEALDHHVQKSSRNLKSQVFLRLTGGLEEFRLLRPQQRIDAPPCRYCPDRLAVLMQSFCPIHGSMILGVFSDSFGRAFLDLILMCLILSASLEDPISRCQAMSDIFRWHFEDSERHSFVEFLLTKEC
jgi:hypothetical protein